MAIFTNRATLSYRGVTASSNVVTGEIVGPLTAEKTALSASYSAGSAVTYIISVINSTDSAVTGVTVTDDLGLGGGTNAPLAYVEGSAALFIDGVRQESVAVDTDNGLEFTGITVPADGSVMLVYGAEVTEYAPLASGSRITNTAVIGGPVSPVTAAFTLPVTEGPVLSVTKSLSPLTVTENGGVTYTFTIENSGNLAAEEEDSVVLADVFDPALTGLTASMNGAPLALGTDYTYSAATGEFATAAGVITVPAATFSEAPAPKIAVTPGKTVVTVTGTLG